VQFDRYLQIQSGCTVATSDSKTCVAAIVFGCQLCCRIFLQVPGKCTDLDLSFRSDSLLQSHTWELIAYEYGKIEYKRQVFASSSHAWSLVACWSHQDHVWIATIQLFYFHRNEPNARSCKLKSNENPPLFKKYPAPPKQKRFQPFQEIVLPFGVLSYWLSDEKYGKYITQTQLERRNKKC